MACILLRIPDMNSYLLKNLFCLSLILVLAGCCPPNGIDKSYTVDEYAIAVDYYSQGSPVAANLVPKNETYVELFDKNAQSEKALYSVRDSELSNRVIYYFNSTWSGEKISSLNIKLSDFVLNNIDFNVVEKAVFQLEPKPYSYPNLSKSVFYLNQIECVIHSVAEIFLPRANAFTCKASSNSTISYRPGTLIQVNLN